MFIFNMKLNGNRASKIFIGLLCTVLLIITFIISFKLLFKTNNKSCSDNSICEITSKNYTNVLKNVHENLNEYIGQKIKISGYVYRLYDFSDDQFVTARNMIVSSDFKTVVVGFLCHSNLAKNYENGDWIEITGTITKGNYNGEIPTLEIEEIKSINVPTSDEFVYPPDDSFVATSTIL